MYIEESKETYSHSYTNDKFRMQASHYIVGGIALAAVVTALTVGNLGGYAPQQAYADEASSSQSVPQPTEKDKNLDTDTLAVAATDTFKADTKNVKSNNSTVYYVENKTHTDYHAIVEKKQYAQVQPHDAARIAKIPEVKIYGYHTRDTYKPNGKQENPARTDYPISPEMYKKIEKESKLWNGKISASGKKITKPYGSGSAYEFLTTEVYKLVYNQGKDQVNIRNFSKRFDVSDEAKRQGWKIAAVEPVNLPAGLSYNPKTDAIEGKIVESLENGVYDNRVYVYVSNGTTTYRYYFASYRIGWIGWMDETAPHISSTNGVVTAQDAYAQDISYTDNGGSTLTPKRGIKNYEHVGITNGSSIEGYAKLYGTEGTGITGDYTSKKLAGTPTRAGIYGLVGYAKDYDARIGKKSSQWTQSPQETYAYSTVAVRPTVSIDEVKQHDTKVAVSVSEGASKLELSLPNNKKVVVGMDAQGTWKVLSSTEQALPKDTELAPVQDATSKTLKFEIKVDNNTLSDSTKKLSATAVAEDVHATVFRNSLSIKDAKNNDVKITLNQSTGHWELAPDKARVETSVNSKKEVHETRIYTELKDEGIDFYAYEFTRVYDDQGNVTEVKDVTRTKTSYAKDKLFMPAVYNANTDTWAIEGEEIDTTLTKKTAADDVWKKTTSATHGTDNDVTAWGDTQDTWTLALKSGMGATLGRVSNKARTTQTIKRTDPVDVPSNPSTPAHPVVPTPSAPTPQQEATPQPPRTPAPEVQAPAVKQARPMKKPARRMLPQTSDMLGAFATPWVVSMGAIATLVGCARSRKKS